MYIMLRACRLYKLADTLMQPVQAMRFTCGFKNAPNIFHSCTKVTKSIAYSGLTPYSGLTLTAAAEAGHTEDFDVSGACIAPPPGALHVDDNGRAGR